MHKALFSQLFKFHSDYEIEFNLLIIDLLGVLLPEIR